MYPLLEIISDTRGFEAAIALIGSDLFALAPWSARHTQVVLEKERVLDKHQDALRRCLRKCMVARQKKNIAKSKDLFQGDAQELGSLRLRNRVVEKHQK